MANQETYNGWSNFETWQAALWLDNTYGLVDGIRNAQGQVLHDDVEAMLDCMTFECLAGETDHGLLGDILTHTDHSECTKTKILREWFKMVNIQEIADNLSEGA